MVELMGLVLHLGRLFSAGGGRQPGKERPGHQGQQHHLTSQTISHHHTSPDFTPVECEAKSPQLILFV
jgi:hypothetical protein